MAKLILTDERQRGLAVLLAADRSAQPVYASTATSDLDHPDHHRLTIRQRTVTWLRDRGYVTTAESPANDEAAGGSRVRPTDRGLRLARQAAALGAAPDPGVDGADPAAAVPREALARPATAVAIAS